MDKRTPSLRGAVLVANTTRPAVSRVDTIQSNSVISAYCRKLDQFAFRRPESTVLRADVGHQWNAMKDPTAATGARAQGADGVHYANWGNQSGGGQAGGPLRPEITVTIGGDRPPRLGGDVVAFEDMREILVAYSEYEQHMHITNRNGGDRVLARRLELVGSATQRMVTDEVYNGKPFVDLSEEELMQGLKMVAGVDILQQMSDDEFGRQIFRVLKMDASVPVNSRVFVQKRALRKYIADSGVAEVVRPDGRQYTLKHGKVLVEAIAAGIEPLEFSRKVEKRMRFDLVTIDLDTLFNLIAKQQRDQAVIEANDDERRQTAKGRDSRSMAAAGTKPQGRAVDEHDSRENAKAAGVKAERSRRYDNGECIVCGKQGHKQWDCPQSQQGKAGKASITRATTPTQQQKSTNGPAQHIRSKIGMAPASATPRAGGY